MAWNYVVPAVFALLGLCVVLYQRRKRKKAEEVAAGLQCWNSYGEMTFDSTVNTTRVLGSFNTGTADGSKVISLNNGEKLWATVNYVIPTDNIELYDLLRIPRVSVSGNTISWNFDDFSVDSYFRNWLYSYRKVTLRANVIYGIYI